MNQSDLQDVLRYFRDAETDFRFLIVSNADPNDAPETHLPPGTSCTWLTGMQSIDDIPGSDHADLGVVFDQVEFMRKTAAMHLLSRLRDRHCKRVVLCVTSPIFTQRELLAMGYIEQKCPSIDGRFFLFDPTLFFERREWNSPEDWANPKNFNRDRW